MRTTGAGGTRAMPSIDRQDTFSGTKDVASTLAIDAARLEAFLASRLPDFKGPLGVRQFKGGQSNPTYLLETPARRYVLRRKPPGKLLPSAHAAVYDAMNATLARLHSFDPAALGLTDFGRGENYVARQVERWSKQYRASETERIDEMDGLIAWLPAHLPPPAAVR